ncbi:hypothetical protein HOD30_03720 [Candidatus Peregrinibacteria bacterium]|jgi:DNA-directed RNA polymerase subunit RPC12/RpoP|nr:hypothetical protein [Candidatus Peregrinibacteria bacterium]MBT4632365.1 hypothetical protein [Candidatus Peregrinibacteria bacterium]
MKYNLSKIRSKSAYTPKEASALLEVNRKTIFRWIKGGLSLLDPKQKPRLIMGKDLKAFIKAKREATQVKLRPNEYYCLVCRKPVEGKHGTQKVEKTGKKIGKLNRDQEILYAKCKECGGKIARLL